MEFLRVYLSQGYKVEAHALITVAHSDGFILGWCMGGAFGFCCVHRGVILGNMPVSNRHQDDLTVRLLVQEWVMSSCSNYKKKKHTREEKQMTMSDKAIS